MTKVMQPKDCNLIIDVLESSYDLPKDSPKDMFMVYGHVTLGIRTKKCEFRCPLL